MRENRQPTEFPVISGTAGHPVGGGHDIAQSETPYKAPLMSASPLSRWLRWQMPYAASCYAYFPVTLTNRVLLRRGETHIGLEPILRRFWDKWGVLSSPLRQYAATYAPVWMNMISGGEYVMSQPLLKRLAANREPFVFSTESFDSFELLSRAYPGQAFFPPWDIGLPVRRMLDQLRPRAIVSVQNAYFPVLLRHLGRRQTPRLFVNALMSRNVEHGNRLMRRALALSFYHELDAIAVQGEEDYEAFKKFGVPSSHMTITGDIAADLAALRLTPEERLQLRSELRLTPGDRVLIAGSAPLGEQEVLVEAFQILRQRLPEARLIIAPRWLKDAVAMAEAFVRRGFRTAFRTALGAGGPTGRADYDVLLLDMFGELRTVYGAADAAFIGSSLVPINIRAGGHNPLEPLAHGVIPLFGPGMNLWRAAVGELLAVWPGLEIHSPEALGTQAALVLTGQAPVAAIQEAGRRLVDRSSGAVDKTAEFIRRHAGLSEPTASTPRETATVLSGV